MYLAKDVLMQRFNVFRGLNCVAVPRCGQCGRDLPDSDSLISCVFGTISRSFDNTAKHLKWDRTIRCL